jgi:HAE1 family hydrophobic/amphiphilic exporter-1
MDRHVLSGENQEKKVGSEAIMVFALAIVLVFLVLAAQYESWSNPAAVIMVVPLAVLGTVVAILMKGADNNVYTQVGIVLLIGMASKNAILIVEFAMAEREKGKGILDSVVHAAKLRFRPILMTSIASVAGFMPLVVASGAGAASQQAIGTAVVGGMIAATFMSLLFTPVFYVVMQKLSGLRKKKPEDDPKDLKATAEAKQAMPEKSS